MPQTPFSQYYKKNVHSWTTLGEWQLPKEFSDWEEEYSVGIQDVALIDLSFRGHIKIEGSDRVDFLQRLLTIDIKAMNLGDFKTGCWLTGRGCIRFVLDVLVLEKEIWLDTHETNPEEVKQAFEAMHFSEDIKCETNGAVSSIMIVGNKSSEVLKEVFNIEELPKVQGSKKVFFDNEQIVLINEKSISENAYQLWVYEESASKLISKLLKHTKLWMGFKALNAVRVQKKYPLMGQDIKETTQFSDLGFDEWANYNKGCYAGQEVVNRIRNLGHPAKLWTAISSQEEISLDSKMHVDNKEVGWITSSTFLPKEKNYLSLGYLKYDYCRQGQKLQVLSEAKVIEATVIV